MRTHRVQPRPSRFCCNLFVPFALSGRFRSKLCLLYPETLKHTHQGIVRNGKQFKTHEIIRRNGFHQVPTRSRKNLKIVPLEFLDGFPKGIEKMTPLMSTKGHEAQTSLRWEQVIYIHKNTVRRMETKVVTDTLEGPHKTPSVEMELTSGHLASRHHLFLKIIKRKTNPYPGKMLLIDPQEVGTIFTRPEWQPIRWPNCFEHIIPLRGLILVNLISRRSSRSESPKITKG
ncbi:hypothetical protein PIB30_046013 [Stylosanthes scabra]|uniref:Ribosomal protein S4 n=1 Tax=Stylosanthes scabra TaxID=79078 RepID=A0ABU6WHF6_9FABA|nr:hypothetical protein [Stylosanthes scabra]